MPSTYSNLKIQLMATGENSTTWGTVTNTNLGTAIEEAIVGSADVTFASNNVTLTLTDSNASQTARNMRLRCTGTTGGVTRNLVVPSIEKPYIVQNDCADSVVVKTSAGSGVTVPAGKTVWVYSDGTNVVDVTTHLSSLTVDGNLGVGVSAPSVKVDVKGVVRSSIGTGTGAGGAGYALYQFGTSATGTENWHIGAEGDGTFRWYNGIIGAGTERMRLSSAGNLTVSGLGQFGTNLRVGATTDEFGAFTSLRKDQNGNSKVSIYNATSGASAVAELSLIGGTGNSYANFSLVDNSGSPFLGHYLGTAVGYQVWDFGGNTRLRLNSDGSMTTYGSNFTVNNQLLIQHDGTNGYIRSTTAASSLYLGAVGTNTVQITTSRLAVTGTISVSSASGTTAGVIGYSGGSLSYGNGSTQFTVATTSGTQNLTDKTLTTGNVIDAGTSISDTGTIAVSSPGFRGLPQSTNTTLALTDAGKHIYTASNVTIPANGSTAFPVGTTIVIANSGSGTLTISITSDTLRQAGTANTGTRTLAAYGLATLVKVASTTWYVSGNVS